VKKDIEICALKLHILSCNIIIIITVYQSPIGNIAYFRNILEAALNQVHNNTADIVLCRDFDINYCNYNYHKQLLNSLLTSYSLYSVIDLPKRFRKIQISC
jgi:hypothetical protein